MKKVLVLLAEGFEMIEGLAVIDVCVRAKLKCDTASISNSREVKSSHGVIIKADKLLKDIAGNQEYDAIVIPGGIPGTYNLRDNEDVINIIKDYNNKGKIVALLL